MTCFASLEQSAGSIEESMLMAKVYEKLLRQSQSFYPTNQCDKYSKTKWENAYYVVHLYDIQE